MLRMSAPVHQYSRWLIALHWTTALGVLTAYLLSEGGPDLRLDPPRWHFTAGMAVLLLVAPRLLARAIDSAPPVNSAGGKCLAFGVGVTHAILYGLLIAVPLTGWYAMSRLGVTFRVFGFSLPPLTAPIQGPVGIVGDLHQWGGNALVILAASHAALALWHHFVRHDDTLRRMRPR
jgi:cytochrome b561